MNRFKNFPLFLGLVFLTLTLILAVSEVTNPRPKLLSGHAKVPETLPTTDFVPGELIIQFAEGQTPEEIEAQVQEREKRVADSVGVLQNTIQATNLKVRNLPLPEESLLSLKTIKEETKTTEINPLFSNFFLVKASTDLPLSFLISQYQKLLGAQTVEPNYIMHTTAVPNDTYYPKLWGMKKMAMESAWDVSTGSNNVIVAVADSGVDYNHEDLNDGRVIKGRNFAYGNNDPMDDHFHGTHVAGTIGAIGNNSKGVTGVNWNVKILAIKVMGADGSGSTDAIAQGVTYAADNGAKVINLSLGAAQPAACPSAFQSAVNSAVQKGTAVVVAAGNSSANAGNYAFANCQNVIVVAATGPDDGHAHYSNYGSVIDVAAPGGNPSGGSGTCSADGSDCILSTVPGGSYRVLTGTSMAAPHVSGLAGLILSKNPGLSPSQLEDLLKSTADNLGNANYFGAGRVNGTRALGTVPTGPTPTATSSPTPSGPTNTPTPTPGGPTPTRTPTPSGSTPTRTPTPTIPLQPPIISFKITFSGMSDNKPALTVKVRVVKKVTGESSNYPGIPVTADAQKIYKNPVPLPLIGISPGSSFDILVKGPKHLQKRLANRVTLVTGINSEFDWSGTPLEPGDLPDPAQNFQQDGVANAHDASLILERLNKDDADSLRVADLNYDGIVNLNDYSLLIQTLSTKYEEED